MRGWGVVLVFVVGIAVGAAGAVYGPRWAEPYLPEGLRAKVELVEGEIVRKQREGERLLLTVVTPEGALLASFKTRVTEITLLADEGDRVTLALPRYVPFVEDPVIRGVKKEAPREKAPE
jgi:hypothetical protein